MRKTLLFTLVWAASISANAQLNTALLKDIVSGIHGSNTGGYHEFNNKVFFAGGDGQGSAAVYITDGTETGTQQIPGLQGLADVSRWYAELNGKMYFPAYNGIWTQLSVGKLWQTDGTIAGTQQAVDIWLYAGGVINLNNKLYFLGFDDIAQNAALMVSDGTQSGTKKFKDIVPAYDGFAYRLDMYLNKLVISCDNGVWMTDGTASGTVRIATDQLMSADLVHPCTEMNGKMYFSLQMTPGQLWVTDGTVSGTQMVKDIPISSSSIQGRQYTTYNNKVYFTLYDAGTFTSELWESDGTDAGTVKIGGPYNTFNSTAVYNGKLYFDADGKLMQLDNTTNQLQQIASTYSSVHDLTVYNGKLFFLANINTPGGALDLMWTDGTTTGTFPAATQLSRNTRAFYPCKLNDGNYLFFTSGPGSQEYNLEPWRIYDFPTNISNTGLNIIKAVYPNPAANTFNIKTGNTDNTTVKIYSLTGQLMLETTETQNINIQHLPVGIYMVQIISNGKTIVEKLIKE
jgi:ELWxxDGT repeat protein